MTAEEGRPSLRRKYLKLGRAADGDWRGAILLGYYTGARLGDVANMRWEAIDWRNKVIRFTPSKTKKPVAIALHRDLERELLKNAGIGKAPMFRLSLAKARAENTALVGDLLRSCRKRVSKGRDASKRRENVIES